MVPGTSPSRTFIQVKTNMAVSKVSLIRHIELVDNIDNQTVQAFDIVRHGSG